MTGSERREGPVRTPGHVRDAGRMPGSSEPRIGSAPIGTKSSFDLAHPLAGRIAALSPSSSTVIRRCEPVPRSRGQQRPASSRRAASTTRSGASTSSRSTTARAAVPSPWRPRLPRPAFAEIWPQRGRAAAERCARASSELTVRPRSSLVLRANDRLPGGTSSGCRGCGDRLRPAARSIPASGGRGGPRSRRGDVRATAPIGARAGSGSGRTTPLPFRLVLEAGPRSDGTPGLGRGARPKLVRPRRGVQRPEHRPRVAVRLQLVPGRDPTALLELPWELAGSSRRSGVGVRRWPTRSSRTSTDT